LAPAFSACALEGTTMTLAQVHELFRAGNSAYQQQQFESARASYLQIAEAGVQSPEFFYNLGNACARLKRTAEAVQYFSRARDLAPHDPDVLANLSRVAPTGVNNAAPTDPFRWMENRLSLRQWMAVFLIVYILFGAAGAAYLGTIGGQRPAALRYAIWSLAAATIIVGVFAARKHYASHNVQKAVVARPALSVRSGPADTFAQVDSLPEGQIVRSLGSAEEGWARVQLSDGRKGYVPAGSLLFI
ncbi:MAG: tetratricopeptide repeat protein, partial [Candidatus Sumerlaeaceae bacterium]